MNEGRVSYLATRRGKVLAPHGLICLVINALSRDLTSSFHADVLCRCRACQFWQACRCRFWHPKQSTSRNRLYAATQSPGHYGVEKYVLQAFRRLSQNHRPGTWNTNNSRSLEYRKKKNPPINRDIFLQFRYSAGIIMIFRDFFNSQ
jgi:hypothetical protein